MDNNKITITIPVNVKWLPVIADTAKKYFQALHFPESLCDMISGSLTEGCDELVRICNEKNMDTPFQVSMDFQENAAVIQVIYNSGIPLHPHQTANYEVPSSMDDLDELQMETLWLHLIKRRMDRVFFKVDGPRQILQMMKYQREADKAHQFWIMGLAPKLREDIKIDIEESKEENAPASAIIQDPVKGTILKLDAGGLFIIQRLDGEKTFHEIYMDYIDKVGMISPQRLALIFEKIEKNGMLEEKKEDGREKGIKYILAKFLNPMFSIPGSDRIISLLYKYTSFIFKPFFVIVLLLVGLSGIVPLITHWDKINRAIMNLGDYYLKNPLLIIPVYFLMIITIIIHEFGHGLTCKHYGGSVNRMGIMFYLTMFVFFCDTSSAWNFPTKWRRIAVSLGGPWFTFIILGLLLNLFGITAGFRSLWEAGLATLILFNFIGLILNFNPFIKMDAYYILMDLTNIPNLRKRSFDFLKNKFFNKPEEGKDIPAITQKEKFIFWLYGVIGATVTVLFILVPLFFYGRQLLFHQGNTGKIIFAVIIIILTLLRLSHGAFLTIRSMRYKEYKLS